ncbi:MAG: phage tail sheath family protein [Chloroflexales bacterium]|nr:phage tail sheath family protein [Chloroflexales bacterium]
MAAFSTINRAPGVYIQEVALPGPIPGVGTSIVGFVGPARKGSVAEPVPITNWSQFTEMFGEADAAGPYIDKVYAAHSVRGFFENGGATCYFVRAGDAAATPDDYKAAIDSLRRVDEITLLCVPDMAGSADVQKHMIEHCETMEDRFAILDSAPPAPNSNTTAALEAVRNQRAGLGSERGYAALYFPWVQVSNPLVSGQILVPPSGHIAGVYARTDATRGVHKVPANEALRGVRGVERVLTDDEQGPLNELGINVIRLFSGRGIVVWGARTLSPKDRTHWRYVNVRRLLLFVEESIQEGTQFAVFEPNDLALWQQVKRQVTEFLTRVWRDGALFGATPDDAFRVRVDEELNPPGVRALGQLVIEVILYPVTPAEYVVFRIVQQPGGPLVQE